jgi:pilus assembly protein CpaD
MRAMRAMRSARFPHVPRGARPAGVAVLLVLLLGSALGACKSLEEPGTFPAAYTLLDPSQKHPIMVSQQPTTMRLSVARGALGLTPAQRAEVADFLGHYRATDAGNSKLLIAVPSGTPNESAALFAVGDIRRIIGTIGFAESNVVVEPYGQARGRNAPIRLSYLRYVAEAPQCGLWPANVADDRRSLPYANFGCAQQHNLAAQIANPADLIVPRTMDAADAERRAVVLNKYRQGEVTEAKKGGTDERVQVQSTTN